MDPKYFKTVHLFVFGASLGLILVGFMIKLGRVDHIPPDKWLIPLIVGLVFLGIEFIIQRKPK